VPYLLEYARALGRKGAVDTALATLAKARDLAPEDPELHLETGFLWMQRKRHKDALASLERAAALAPDDPRPWFFVAVVYGDRLGKPEEARDALRRYVELGGKEPAALTWLAELESGD